MYYSLLDLSSRTLTSDFIKFISGLGNFVGLPGMKDVNIGQDGGQGKQQHSYFLFQYRCGHSGSLVISSKFWIQKWLLL